MKTDWVSVKEAARRRGCTLKYVYDLLAAGRIPGARKIGKVWQIPLGGVAPVKEARESACARAGERA